MTLQLNTDNYVSCWTRCKTVQKWMCGARFLLIKDRQIIGQADYEDQY